MDYIGQASEGTQASSAPPIRTVVINGKHFVSGLFWQPLTRPRDYMKEAREIGKRENMDIVAIRRGKILQAGFAPKGQGARKGMYSLAAALAGILGDGWIGAFRIDHENYALVAVDQGAILPMCDMIARRDHVLNTLRTYYNFTDWEKIYCPKDFDFGGEEQDIHELLVPQRLSKEYQLRPLAFGLTGRELTLVAVAAAAVIGAPSYYMYKKAEEERLAAEAAARAEAERLRQLEELNRRAKAEQEAKALEHPWAKMPAVADFIQGCLGLLDRVPLSISGWVFKGASCNADRMRLEYVRATGVTLDDFFAGVKTRFNVEPDFRADGESATFELPQQLLFGGDDPVGPMVVALRQFRSHFQRLDISPEMQEIKPPVPPAPLPGQDPATIPEPVIPEWTGYTFGFQSHLTPALAFNGLDGTGVRLSELEVSLDETAVLTWKYTGAIYGKR